MPYEYEYPRPALTVDLVVLRPGASDYEVLLIRRKGEPFAGRWALPGGFVNEGETPERAAWRELKEETGLRRAGNIRQVGAFADPGRDPRGWTVAIAYLVRIGLAPAAGARAGDDADAIQWVPVRSYKRLLLRDGGLAFDHGAILEAALQMTRG